MTNQQNENNKFSPRLRQVQGEVFFNSKARARVAEIYEEDHQLKRRPRIGYWFLFFMQGLQFNLYLLSRTKMEQVVYVVPFYKSSSETIVVALGPILITTSTGMTEGYSAILLPQLEKDQKLDVELSSWIASIASLPMPLGCVVGGILMEKTGRKTIHMITCVPCLIGWLILYFGQDTILILIGRFLTGLCVGLLGPATGVYMSETSEQKFRGFLLASISFAIAMGLFLSHLFGTFLTWHVTALLSCISPVSCFVLMFFVPESPTWLAKRGRLDQAKAAHVWCRGTSEEAEAELRVLLERQQQLDESNADSDRSRTEAIVESCKQLTKPEFFKPALIIVWFHIVSQWSGVNAITFYSVSIIQQSLSGGFFDEYLAMLILDFFRLVMSTLACYLLKKIGRRPLAIVSGCGTFLSLLVLALSIYLSKIIQPSQAAIFGYVSLVALVTYISFISIGFVPLPLTMAGEVFPVTSRGIGSGISSVALYVSFFSVVKTTPLMFSSLGADGTFLVYGLVGLVGTVVLVVCLPETKDKPLYEIEDYFKNTSKHKNAKVI